MHSNLLERRAWFAGLCLAFCCACAPTRGDDVPFGSDDDDAADGSTGAGGQPATSGMGGGGDFSPGTGGGSTTPSGDPTTCEDAAKTRTYIGCDFWPTVVATNVWSIFDFAAVVANAGLEPAEVKVERKGQVIATATVQPGSLGTVYLPWVPALKGPDADECGIAKPFSGSVRVDEGAYHLTSTRPVAVYQFNALEYQGKGGPPGKDWSSCPGNKICNEQIPIGCFSFSNDASLLLPSTALTGNYRVTGQAGWAGPKMSSYFAITATKNGTQVQVSPTAKLTTGGGVPASGAFTLSLDAGDVVQVVADPAGDPSGTLVKADQPIQVIAGIPCIQSPLGVPACDHIEETVFPAETLGKHYVVSVPTSPNGAVVGHVVRLYGNIDGTELTYTPAPPSGAPSKIDAGEVVDLGVVESDFAVTGSKELAVATFQLGAELVDPDAVPPEQRGDPSQSMTSAVEQFRTEYVFLAPKDYDESWADIIMPMTATVIVDGSTATIVPTAVGDSGYGVARVKLGPGNDGAHVIEASERVGVQVMGYGAYTSYQYPAGLDLVPIAPPPPK